MIFGGRGDRRDVPTERLEGLARGREGTICKTAKPCTWVDEVQRTTVHISRRGPCTKLAKLIWWIFDPGPRSCQGFFWRKLLLGWPLIGWPVCWTDDGIWA